MSVSYSYSLYIIAIENVKLVIFDKLNKAPHILLIVCLVGNLVFKITYPLRVIVESDNCSLVDIRNVLANE
jgi:hypothetical protein